MSLSYPLTLPSAWLPKRRTFRMVSNVSVSRSPFTNAQQVYVHQGAMWGLDEELIPMKRDDFEDCNAILSGLNGMEGTVLIGPHETAVRGTWAGSPKVFGAHAAGVRSIAMDGYTAAATAKAGDWFQHGTGSDTHLYKLTKDATADGSGLATLEIWPPLRAALADNDTFDITSPVGQWRLASNSSEWAVEVAGIYYINAQFIEALGV